MTRFMKNGYVYKLTLLVNTESFLAGEIYVGKHNGQKTNYYTGGKVVKNLLEKYGESIFKRDFLAKEIAEENLLNYLEVYYIALFKCNRCRYGTGLNLTDGGEGTTGIKKTQEQIDNLKMAIAKRMTSVNYKSARGREVHMYDSTGQYIQSFSSSVEAAKIVGGSGSSVLKCSKNAGNHKHKGYYFSTEKLELIAVKEEKGTPVYQFSLSGEFIKSYTSIVKASEETGILAASISSNCRELTSTSGGFVWSYLNRFPSNVTCKVQCFDENGNLLAEAKNSQALSCLVGLKRHRINVLIKDKKHDRQKRTYRRVCN